MSLLHCLCCCDSTGRVVYSLDEPPRKHRLLAKRVVFTVTEGALGHRNSFLDIDEWTAMRVHHARTHTEPLYSKSHEDASWVLPESRDFVGTSHGHRSKADDVRMEDVGVDYSRMAPSVISAQFMTEVERAAAVASVARVNRAEITECSGECCRLAFCGACLPSATGTFKRVDRVLRKWNTNVFAQRGLHWRRVRLAHSCAEHMQRDCLCGCLACPFSDPNTTMNYPVHSCRPYMCLTCCIPVLLCSCPQPVLFLQAVRNKPMRRRNNYMADVSSPSAPVTLERASRAIMAQGGRPGSPAALLGHTVI